MSDATHTLRAIVADCVENELRWQTPGALIEPNRVGNRVADDVVRRMRDAGIQVTS